MGNKKVMVGILTVGLAFGTVSTVALASVPPSKESIQELFRDSIPSFEEMLPFMKKMHPNLTDEQLENMYKSCHGEGGMMRNPNAIPRQTNVINL
ncbi:FAD/FMN-containing dehydrogenase [Calidifontibacillus erzurumensis]|uniref:FAD/FMN-containing dehydrogenase n=1 Tax=Calidifontibacillus erzurumensis TaxID=2741433 RepID=A0A8J8GD80_9BACI|nr:FAD/FMN-containing dehydrogenase [Calidifontibacillus erzurumensis]NSL51389.1 FAD/FMN-containing dehydrogenase [Calidifontibacillus erzurumensis]